MTKGGAMHRVKARNQWEKLRGVLQHKRAGIEIVGQD